MILCKRSSFRHARFELKASESLGRLKLKLEPRKVLIVIVETLVNSSLR